MSEILLRGPRVSLSPRLLFFGLLLGLLLSWPLLIYGRPAYIGDSAAYYKGGRFAVSFMTDKISHRSAPSAANGGLRPEQTAVPSAGGEARAPAQGVRSITYSVAAYLLGSPNAQMIWLAIAQAMLTGVIAALTLHLLAPASIRLQLIAALILAFATPLAFVACLAVPDIFTGLTVFAIVLPAIALPRLRLSARILLAAVGIFAVSAHASHPPLAAGLTALAVLWLVWAARRGDRTAYLAMAWTAAPLVLGIALTLVANRVGFGESSIIAKRFPLTLARSVADGPGRWYLEEHCRTKHFAICEVYPNGFPKSVTTFLWGDTGLPKRASPEQMDRIRAEEATVVVAAAREYPGTEAAHLVSSFLKQLVVVWPENFDMRMKVDSTGIPAVAPVNGVTNPVSDLIEALSLISAAIGLLWMGLCFRQFSVAQRSAIVLVVSALMINAAICVFFSGVTPRYQARVIWLIPFLALALGGSLRSAARTRAQPDLGSD